MTEPTIYTAPPGTGEAILGKTLTGLLYEACERFTNPEILNQPEGDGWIPYSLDSFRVQSEEMALGLLECGLTKGEHVALFMESDVYFCIADMGCLLAGLANVPIYLSSAPEAVKYILEHAEVRALCVSNIELLEEIAGIVAQIPAIQLVILAEGGYKDRPGALPDEVKLLTLDEVRAQGKAIHQKDPKVIRTLREQVDPHDLATIIYTSGTTGTPKGVMLTHENISFNTMSAFSGLTGYRAGAGKEVAISFLPLTHIFARALHYGHIAYGTSVYFTTPDALVDDLQKVKPTAFATVPRLLEKIYSRIQERTSSMTGVKGALGKWAWRLAHEYELGQEPQGLRKLQYKTADALVYKKWRQAVGGHVRFVICGGAALNGTLANVFAAASVPIFQGYGLTETSPVIAYNRPLRNRAGTVGEPMMGVEVMIAEDGEILTRGPHVMQGYFKEEEKTREVLSADGWFHTGDIGAFTEDGFLRITDRKKSLFKLSTGKYVMPQPLENRLGIEALIEHAVVVGAGHKYCTALIFPEEEALRTFAKLQGLDANQPVDALLKESTVIAHYQSLVDTANEGMDHWSTIKKFVLVAKHLTIENGLLTPTLKVKRAKVRQSFEDEITALYDESKKQEGAITG